MSLKDTVEGIEKGLSSEHPELRKAAEKTLALYNTGISIPEYIVKGTILTKDYITKYIANKLKTVPEEHQKKPSFMIAREVISGIKDTIDQETLRDAFLNMLAKSMDDRNDDSLYPSYLSIIKELGGQGLAYFVDFTNKYQAYRMFIMGDRAVYHEDKNLIDFSQEMVPTKITMNIPKKAILDNWKRLGLIELSQKPDIDTGVKKSVITLKPKEKRFAVILTDLGKDFITTVAD